MFDWYFGDTAHRDCDPGQSGYRDPDRGKTTGTVWNGTTKSRLRVYIRSSLSSRNGQKGPSSNGSGKVHDPGSVGSVPVCVQSSPAFQKGYDRVFKKGGIIYAKEKYTDHRSVKP